MIIPAWYTLPAAAGRIWLEEILSRLPQSDDVLGFARLRQRTDARVHLRKVWQPF